MQKASASISVVTESQQPLDVKACSTLWGTDTTVASFTGALNFQEASWNMLTAYTYLTKKDTAGESIGVTVQLKLHQKFFFSILNEFDVWYSPERDMQCELLNGTEYDASRYEACIQGIRDANSVFDSYITSAASGFTSQLSAKLPLKWASFGGNSHCRQVYHMCLAYIYELLRTGMTTPKFV